MKTLAYIWFASFVTMIWAKDEPRAEFRVLGYGDGFFEGVFFERAVEAGKEKVYLRFLPNQKSRRYLLPEGERSVSFYREIDGEEGETRKVQVADYSFPGDSERSLLVFFETSDFERSRRYEIVSLDESPAVWHAGCVRFLNLSGAELTGQFDGSPFEVPHDVSETLYFDPDDRTIRNFKLSVPWAGRERVVYSSRFSPDPQHPKLLVIKRPLEEGGLKVRVETLW